MGSVAQVFETRRLAGISCSSVCKQEDWLGSVGQVFVNKKITFTYIVDDTLKLLDQSCSRTAKDQLYKGVFRTVFENRSQEFCDWQASHEEFRTVQGTA